MMILQTIEKLSEFYPLAPMVHEEKTHSTWFVPQTQPLPLTLFWKDGEDSLTCMLALGKPGQGPDATLPLQLMTLNLMMAAHGGPRFSYSRTSGMLTLIDFISQETLEAHNIYTVRDQIDALIRKSQQVRQFLEKEGIPLAGEQE